eukprot:TRINITY_DN844_c0_g1_i1.p1 TRINITY_DN844_c0_g1~~TRINITY_DN844_c0_g1_i1.p1  ORF type:complete len:497 (+),score=162.20 TRINITY_DN844_c0_g1_i1:1566-3056(+)
MRFGNYYQKEEPFDVEKAWASEEKMGKRSRRARYRCGPNYLRLVDILPWPQYYEKYLKPDEPEPIVEPTTVTEPEVVATEAEAVTTEAEAEAVTTEAVAAPEQAQAQGEERSTEEGEKPTEEGETPVEEKKETIEEEKETAEEKETTEEKETPTEEKETPAEEKKETTEETPDEKETKSDSDTDSDESSSSEEEEARYAPNKEINRRIAHIRGDITRLEIDAVVNAANTSLLGGGGIDGAIHSTAGPDLLRECRTLKGAKTGETKITRGYKLPAKYVLHTVGPRGEYEEYLESCYKSVLALCLKHNIRSVALCGISTGIFGYPLYNASHVACRVVREWLEVEENRNAIDRIIFCTFLEKEQTCYEELLQEYFPYTPDPEFIQEWSQHVQGYESAEELTQESSESSESSSSESESEDEDAPAVIFGKAQLVDGEVEVKISTKGFEKKWEDFYYQITPVGSYAQVYVKQELKDGKFVIATNDANKNARVHWQIRGEDW